MKTKSKVKSGAVIANHNLRVRSGVKAGLLIINHNLWVRKWGLTV
jgi:hypothetical protein